MNTKPPYPRLEKLDSMEAFTFSFWIANTQISLQLHGKTKQAELFSSKFLLTQLVLTYQNRLWYKNSIRNDCSPSLKYLRKLKAELNRIVMSFPLHLIKNPREVG